MFPKSATEVVIGIRKLLGSSFFLYIMVPASIATKNNTLTSATTSIIAIKKTLYATSRLTAFFERLDITNAAMVLSTVVINATLTTCKKSLFIKPSFHHFLLTLFSYNKVENLDDI